jgi:uncharacterized membrane protein YhaH (DUF805 family)
MKDVPADALVPVEDLTPVTPGPLDLFHPRGAVSQRGYVAWGVALTALKHNLDRVVAQAYFGKSWSIFHYVFPGAALGGSPTSPENLTFLATMLALSLPFLWPGLMLTRRRLRAVGLHPYWVALFVLPGVNLLFFALLAMLPDGALLPEASDEPAALPSSEPAGEPGSSALAKKDPAALDAGGEEAARPWLDRWIPDSAMGSAAMACGLVIPPAFGLTLASVFLFSQYGAALFLGVPFWLGMAASLLHGMRRPRGLLESVGVGVLANLLCGLALFVTAVEGLVCLAMAAPLAAAMGGIGAGLGYLLQAEGRRRVTTGMIPRLGVLLLLLPGLMGMESHLAVEHPVYRVDTALVIDAPPEAVWPHVIEFPELDPPVDWVFSTGVAYPLHARIEGRGVGAIRHCVFTTGAFVEPIEVWDEPRRLAFSVLETPHPMTEWTPFPGAPPPHLEEFMVSRGGEFRLVPLPGGRTRLEGTTWYQHHMWPASYWHQWASFVMHRIHLRVLRHIRRRAEG